MPPTHAQRRRSSLSHSSVIAPLCRLKPQPIRSATDSGKAPIGDEHHWQQCFTSVGHVHVVLAARRVSRRALWGALRRLVRLAVLFGIILRKLRPDTYMGRAGTCTVRQANNSTHATTPEEDAREHAANMQSQMHGYNQHTTRIDVRVWTEQHTCITPRCRTASGFTRLRLHLL